MQSIAPAFSAISQSSYLVPRITIVGTKFIGQASTQLAQLIQFISILRVACFSLSRTKPEEPLVIGVSKVGIANPIIGPPEIIAPTFSVVPPAPANSSE